eukprot:COSAG02_NODE_14885_length_1226_cov_2.167702_1_plen_159_part_00
MRAALGICLLLHGLHWRSVGRCASRQVRPTHSLLIAHWFHNSPRIHIVIRGCDLPLGCACFEWRDPGTRHPVPQQPSCLVTNRSTAVDPSSYGYSAYVNKDRPPGPPPPPPPTPAPAPPVRPPLYTIRGAIEVDTNENTMFMWHEQLYVLENMCVSGI